MTHYYQDDSYCFLTCRTQSQKNIFDTNQKKEIILEQFNKVKTKFNLDFIVYAVLINHYHIMFYLEKGKDIYKITQMINGGSSFLINRMDKIDRGVWDNYWTNFFYEDSYYRVLGYIAGNPLKHGVVKNWQELKEYKYCNAKEVVNRYGEETIKDLIGEVMELNWEDEQEFLKNRI